MRRLSPLALGALALCAAPALLGCERVRVFVGTLPCSEDERVLCAPHERVVLAPMVVQFGADDEQAATIVWEHSLRACVTALCEKRVNDFLVHDDGEVAVATVRAHEDGGELWVEWLDDGGQHLFETAVPESSAWLKGGAVTQLALERDAVGNVMMLAGRYGESSDGTSHGSVRGYTIARSGEIALGFDLDAGQLWPDKVRLLDADVLISRSTRTNNVEVGRYRHGGEMRWRQTEVARPPGPDEVGLEFAADTLTVLHELEVDHRGRIWGSLFEGLPGLVQLDADGVVASHVLMVGGFGTVLESSPMPIAIDGHDRPIIGFVEMVVRFNPNGTKEQQLSPHASIGNQEQFWPQTVMDLAVDDQNNVYVATQDGPRSQRRLLIERISAAFTERERFVLPIGSQDTASNQLLDELQISGAGDAYVRIAGAKDREVGPGELDDGSPETRIVRVRLGE